jgi:hypothetical protein
LFSVIGQHTRYELTRTPGLKLTRFIDDASGQLTIFINLEVIRDMEDFALDFLNIGLDVCPNNLALAILESLFGCVTPAPSERADSDVN